MPQALLDEEQQEAVDFEGSVFLEAGPGSGKTRVLTEKARQIFNKGEQLLCLAFTKSAAAEMASRVIGIPATTIHSYCCGRVGWETSWGYTGLLYRFLMQEDIDEVDNLLVDETQDLNELEMDVVLSLARHGKIFAVGDPYQSIYGFQGAMGPKIEELLIRSGCTKKTLKNNYRSCPEVVDRLNKYFPRDLVSKNIKDTGLNFILCRTNDDVFQVSGFLKERQIPHKLRLSVEHSDIKEKEVCGPSCLRVMSVHQSKGLEADKVALFDWKPNDVGEEERILYVAMSRASKEFVELDNLEEVVKWI